jgi:hypothetical protein
MGNGIQTGREPGALPGATPSQSSPGGRVAGSLWTFEAGRLVRGDGRRLGPALRAGRDGEGRLDAENASDVTAGQLSGRHRGSSENRLDERLRRLEEGLLEMERELKEIRWEPIHLRIEPSS